MHPRIHARAFPDKPAVIMAETGGILTYRELEARANRGAHFLRRLGLSTGDTVAIWLPNVPEYFEVYWAAQRAGLFITPISTRLTADEAAYILADSKAKVLVSSSAIESLEPLLAVVRRAAPELEHIVNVGPETPGQRSWSECGDQPDTPIADESAGFHMVYSSGTTGRPKGVRIPLTGGPATESHRLAEKQQARYGTGPHSVYLSPAPLYHTAPLAFTTSTHRLGGTVVVMQKFEPEAALAAIEQYRVTVTQMVPTMFLRMLRLPDDIRRKYDLTSLTHVVHAAAPCPVPVKEQMIEWFGPIIYEYYGGSEGSVSTFIGPEEWLRKKGSVGRGDDCTLHVCDEDGRELPPGTPGIVYADKGWEFQYHNDPEKTRGARHPLHQGWATLGDIGYVDEDGYLFLTDRKSFMIISGGVNIYPQEVENLLILHPKVADVAVFGVPNAEMGEEVKAVVQARDPSTAGPDLEAELLAYCRSHLSSLKCPRSIDFQDELPRHETGKLYKRLLRDRYWAAHESRIA